MFDLQVIFFNIFVYSLLKAVKWKEEIGVYDKMKRRTVFFVAVGG